MQTIQFIQTVRWLEAQFSGTPLLHMILQGEVLHARRGPGEFDPKVNEPLLTASHQLAMLQPRLQSRPLVPAIMNAFGLSVLLDPSFPVQLAKITLTREKQESVSEVMRDLLHDIVRAWRCLSECVGPIEGITTPDAVTQEKDFDDILTVQLEYEQGKEPTVQTISNVLKDANDLYLDVAKLLGAKDAKTLVAIYVASGSDYRFDFKGLGEPIKEIKNLLVEIWGKIRHRQADILERKNTAVLSSLTALEKLKDGRDKQAISQEDADKFAEKIIKASLDLFKHGALIREIPAVEAVSNQKLIEGFQQKQLPGATVTEQLPSTKSKKSEKRKKSKAKEKKEDENPPLLTAGSS